VACATRQDKTTGQITMEMLKTFKPAMPPAIRLLLCLGLLAGLWSQPSPARAGLWCRGDLHSHSTYSDGDSSPAAVVAEAESMGLDFFALTDHDGSLGGVPSNWSDPGYASDELVLLYGMEWTTALGHANVWAATPFDYAPLWQAHRNRDPAAAALAMHEQGGLFSINHPAEYVICPWSYPTTVEADCIEIWNALYSLPGMNRMAAHTFWDNLLQEGRRITAVGGSDTHHLKKWLSLFYDLAMPTTWVWAEERSAEAILAGMKNGHVTISYASDAPRLELTADADGDGQFEIMMGDAAPENPDAVLRMKLSVAEPDNQTTQAGGTAQELGPAAVKSLREGGSRFTNAVGKNKNTGTKPAVDYLACVYKNGILYRAWLMRGVRWLLFSAPAQAGDYFRAELMGLPQMPLPLRLLYGYTIAVTNPVYVDPPAQ
jgi:hypothetical protein